MAQGAAAKAGFRRLIDSLNDRAMLVPHLEAALTSRGHRSWPETFPIRIVNKEREFDGYFHPSAHAAMPPLLIYQEFAPRLRGRLELPIITSRDVMTLMLGSAAHSVVESMLMELGFCGPEDIEVGFRNEVRMCAGALDVRRVELPKMSERPMVEIKTINRLPRVFKEPLPEHVLQMQPYLDLGAEHADYGILLYVEKPWPHGFKEFHVERDPALLEGIYSKWRSVREAIAVGNDNLLRQCPGCERSNPVHANCPARFICRIGPPERRSK